MSLPSGLTRRTEGNWAAWPGPGPAPGLLALALCTRGLGPSLELWINAAGGTVGPRALRVRPTARAQQDGCSVAVVRLTSSCPRGLMVPPPADPVPPGGGAQAVRRAGQPRAAEAGGPAAGLLIQAEGWVTAEWQGDSDLTQRKGWVGQGRREHPGADNTMAKLPVSLSHTHPLLRSIIHVRGSKCYNFIPVPGPCSWHPRRLQQDGQVPNRCQYIMPPVTSYRSY